MLEGRHIFLVAVCITALCNQVAAEGPLDMALDAVDDMYEGCTKDALKKFVLSNLLKEELNNSDVFQMAWRHSQFSNCSQMIPGGVKEHITALRTYITDDKFRKILNDAVNTFGTNVTTYENNFHFKSLHFLLMDSIRLLNPGTCKTVYAFSDITFKNFQKGSNVRLGRFFTGYSSLEILKKDNDLEEEIILNITTCFFAELGKNICNDEQMTFFSPTEVFTLKDVISVKENDETYQMVVLKHSQLKSQHNCYIFSRSLADVPPHWFALALLSSSFFILS